MLCQEFDLLLHPFDLESDVMQALAVIRKLILPGAWFANRLDQIQGDLPEWEKGKLGARLGG